MTDETVFVGMVEGKPLYAMPHDLPELHVWQQAKTQAAAQTFGGHQDWRIPTKSELRMLYKNKRRISGLATSWYWSSSECPSKAFAWGENFYSGYQEILFKQCKTRVRCVRGG